MQQQHTAVVGVRWPPPTQVVFEPQAHPEASKLGARLRSEWVVAVTGQLRKRKDPNSKIKTGGGARSWGHAGGWVVDAALGSAGGSNCWRQQCSAICCS